MTDRKPVNQRNRRNPAEKPMIKEVLPNLDKKHLWKSIFMN